MGVAIHTEWRSISRGCIKAGRGVQGVDAESNIVLGVGVYKLAHSGNEHGYQ
jgi:hypothetical protein